MYSQKNKTDYPLTIHFQTNKCLFALCKRALFFSINIPLDSAEDVEVKISDKPVKIFSVFKQKSISSVIDFAPRGYDVLLIEEI